MLAEFGDAPNARILAAAKYGSEAQYFEREREGERNFHLNGVLNSPAWNGGGADTVDPISDH
ncbi:hypothetical protein CQ14_06905 [Bradyrhizobium lablabi]|uniref:Uncharacterized protein n=1 Tax=Bradyrhizobium lablabi TaxID=722472 RepID=A0A0R3MU92_9BRAD|nr:hypothetical protein CQ14_06905 [Bradyrhizobium lablabi]